MFRKILFATTASPVCDEAAKVAFDLARKYSSEIKVLHVYGLPPRGFSTEVKSISTGDEVEATPEYENQLMEELYETYRLHMDKVSTCSIEARLGEPHREILREVRGHETDLVVMGAHTRVDETGSLRYRNTVGNTMQKVAKKCRAPLLVVSRPCTTCFWYFENIIFGTDLSRTSDAAFAFALKTARETGARLYLFHALKMSDTEMPENQLSVEERLAEAKERMEQRYLPMAEGFDNLVMDVWEGTPYVEILKYARERKADLVVMSHHGRRGNEESDMGSTVEQVVLRSACPVASVNYHDRL